MLKGVFSWSALMLAAASSLPAQLISIRTVPISQEAQFNIFPSATASMGGISIAVSDALRDPFVNPAYGAKIGATRFFGSPGAYTITSNAGGGRTLPIGALSKRGAWYGGMWLALQEVDLNNQSNITPVPFACPACDSQEIDFGPSAQSKGNAYAFGMAGKDLGNGLSLGSSFSWSRLNAIDGVDLLYSGSARIVQFGHDVDVRVGLLKEWANQRTLETMIVHNRFDTKHDVFYLDSFWDPGLQQFAQQPRLEKNLDKTNTWGLHLAYEQPLSAPGWRAGAMLTANRMDHPKIPNYEIMNIPRDPGNSSAFNIGFGLGRSINNSTFGVDFIYEPIWSHTWADSETPVTAINGRVIPPGGMTIENNFRFSNAQLRMGLQQAFALGSSGPLASLQLGLAVHAINYTLNQQDHTQLTKRTHDESWTEWKPTWGFSLGFPELEVRYQGSALNGTGRPGVFPEGPIAVLEAAGGSNILAAPRGPLTLTEVRVMTHQISVSVPIH
jgi:hypothetical protein